MPHPHLQRMGQIPTSIHPFAKQELKQRETTATLILHQTKPVWFDHVADLGQNCLIKCLIKMWRIAMTVLHSILSFCKQSVAHWD